MWSLRNDVNSPLGKYGQLVAAALAVLIVGAWIVGEFLLMLRISVQSPAGLKEVALIAVGAVFGAAATVNGVKGDIEAASHKAELAHARLDESGVPHHPAYETVTADPSTHVG
jgi:hypothetical protein